MKTFICKNCGNIINKELLEDNYICDKCGTSKDNFDIYNENNMENELDFIIDSVIDDAENIKSSKIINLNEEQKSLEIDDNNKCIYKNIDKCINCGQCKKTCENIANLEYDLRICKNPICTGCGQCYINCPTNSIEIKSDYKKVKEIINLNEKIVIAVLSSAVTSSLSEILEVDKKENIEKKVVEALKKLGFDFVFDSGYGNDLNSFEYTAELLDRISKKRELPMFTSYCPVANNYIQIYKPQLINNLSTCKTPLKNQSIIIKKYYSNKKGFDPSKLIVVGITPCVGDKNLVDENLDYVLTSSELKNILNEEKININNLKGMEFDDILGSGSSSSVLCNESGGVCESVIKTLYKLLNKKNAPIDLISFDQLKENKDIKELNVIINKMKLKVAVIQKMESLDAILRNDYFKNFHLIEIMNCEGGCIGGGGLPKDNNNLEVRIKSRKYNLNMISKTKKYKLPFDNRNIKQLYKEYLVNPYSDISKEILNNTYEDLSKLLTGKTLTEKK